MEYNGLKWSNNKVKNRRQQRLYASAQRLWNKSVTWHLESPTHVCKSRLIGLGSGIQT